jgi:WD40 repeat protein
MTSIPWKKINTITSNVRGKVRSLAWHSSSMFLGAAGITFGFEIWDMNRNWTKMQVESRSTNLPPRPPDTYVHFMDWSPANEFVVDRTVYELYQQSNVFTVTANRSVTPVSVRAIAVLDACRLCTLSQWSPDGQFIATAFGSEISISQLLLNNTGQLPRWKSIQNWTTVQETYMVITAMAWSPDGNYLAVGGAGNYSMFVYDMNNRLHAPLVIPTVTQYGIDALAWRPDSQQIAIGTARVIEIRELRWKEVSDTYLPPDTADSSYTPSSAPSSSSIMLIDPVSRQVKSGISDAGMAAIGIAAVVTSLSCVAFVFRQRLKLVSQRNSQRRKKRNEYQEYFENGEIESTMSDEDFTSPNPMDCMISIPKDRINNFDADSIE